MPSPDCGESPSAQKAPTTRATAPEKEQSESISNPFAEPWKLKREASSQDAQRTTHDGQPEASSQDARRTTHDALKPTRYTLTPNLSDPATQEAPASQSENAVGGKSASLPQSDASPASLASAARTTGGHLDPNKVAELARSVHQIAAKYDVSHIGSRGVGGGMNFYSIEKEQMLGKELSQQVEHNTRLLSDPVITEYVNRLGQNLVRHSDAQVPFTIKVVDDDQINAFALPGGFFYVNTGLILAADNEAELAGVMAHEIAHVAARHATKNATKRDIWDVVSLPLIFVGGPAGAAVRQVAGIATPMGFLKFSRDAEREADLLGMEYQYAAGYDPAAFVNFFEKLQGTEKKKPGFMAKAFSTHPMTEDRVRRAEVELATMLPARDEYITTTSEFDEIKARLQRITNGRSISNGRDQKPVLKKRVDSSQ